MPEEKDKSNVVALAPKAGVSITLAQNLERTERHPVLIFGASRAGKTLMIISLIQALRTSGEVSVHLGEPVLDRADPRSAAKHKAARTLYERQTYTVDAGAAAASTQADPFFVPIDVMPRNSQRPPVKFAFLDGRGELYEPNTAAELDFYKPLNEDVRDLLDNFSYGVTTIYMAPYSMGSEHDRDTREGDHGLLGVLEKYGDHRKMRSNDFHLFLLSKWDQYASPMDPNMLFDRPTPMQVDTVLRERYPLSWGAFQGLPLEGPAEDRRSFMQYSSGYFVKGNPQRPPLNFEPSFARYPRTVLNWLYGNALRFRAKEIKTGRMYTFRQTLFDDVVSPYATRVSVSEKLASLLTSR